jgi:hypothetical protein
MRFNLQPNQQNDAVAQILMFSELALAAPIVTLFQDNSIKLWLNEA